MTTDRYTEDDEVLNNFLSPRPRSRNLFLILFLSQLLLIEVLESSSFLKVLSSTIARGKETKSRPIPQRPALETQFSITTRFLPLQLVAYRLASSTQCNFDTELSFSAFQLVSSL